jgi:hypothetical protein
MAVNGQPNSEYILQALVADLNEIQIANGYFSDVRKVLRPEFWLDNEKALMDTVNAAQDGATILLWPDSDGEYENGLGHSTDRCVLTVAMFGVAKQSEGAQLAAIRLAADVRRRMRANPQRNFPGKTGGNEYGINTVSAGNPTFDYGYARLTSSSTVGYFYSRWSAIYMFPLATG